MLAVALLFALAAGTPVGAKEASETATRVAALEAQYAKLRKHADTADFSQRMDVIRALGKLDSPRARAFLLDIVRRGPVVDDKVLAVLALGNKLDVPTATSVADLIAKDPAPVLVEALDDAFGRTNDERVLTWLATRALDHASPAVVQAALDAQYAHADPRARDRALALFAAWDKKRAGMAIAHAAVRALGSINGGEVRPFLIKVAKHQDWRIRLAVADVAAWQKPFDGNVRSMLRTLLEDDVPVVRQRAAASIADAKLEELLPEVAVLLDAAEIKTRAVAHAALRKLTHRDLGYDRRDWLLWWDRKTTTRGGIKPSPSSSVVSYYGVTVQSDRMLFIVDVSGSMSLPRRPGAARIDVARSELRTALAGLDEKALFNVIVFSDKVRTWRKSEVRATKPHRAQVLKWVDKNLADPRGGTYMHAALERAFADNPRMDTIYLLSDGLASDGEPIVPEAILASVRSWNRYRRVVVNTFALTLEDDMPGGLPDASIDPVKRFMQDLANVTGGECTVVERAP